MTGNIIVKTPLLCECYIKIDDHIRILNGFNRTHVIKLPHGTHRINAGIDYDQMPESRRVYRAQTWAWERDQEVYVSQKDILINIWRKWHLLKPVTAVAEIDSTDE